MTTDTTTSLDARALSPTLAAVARASVEWIRGFNAGDVDACVDGYTETAIMEARPVGRFVGREAIDGFWRPFVAKGAGELVYRDVELRELDARTVELSASWSMNVGRGVITCERWTRGSDGRWRLAYDAFEIHA